MPVCKTLIEYGTVAPDSGLGNLPDTLRNVFLPPASYEQLQELVLQNMQEYSDQLLKPVYQKPYGMVLKARQFVGVLQTKDGTMLEILPKVCCEDDENLTKKIFFKMLKYLKDYPFKQIDSAALHTDNLPIYEIFIKMFLLEVEKIIKSGLAADYLSLEENQPFLKGKLLFNQQIKYNATHQERFFVAYDEFCHNRPENRLIKSALRYLGAFARSNENQKRIREFVFTFDGIDYSINYSKDFQGCKKNRTMHRYQKVLQWCRIFLNKESFSCFSGSEAAPALMFDMNKVFENYVAHRIKTSELFTEFTVDTQDCLHHLIEYPQQKFQLKPDIVLKSYKLQPVVLDTKWKIVDQTEDISQADLYQMYAYGKKYQARQLILIYPSLQADKLIQKHYHYHKDDLKLDVFFYNLTDDEQSIKELRKLIDV